MEETEAGSSPDAGSSRTLESIAIVGLARGAMVGRYVVIDRVGAGGMGVVYAAYDPELDRKVAIKLLHRRTDGSTGDGAQVRLLREAQSLAKLQHPEVLTVLDVGVHEGRVFAAMEFVDGQTARAWLREQSRAPQQVLEVFAAAGRGLAAAHAKGLVHRDFKPDNVMLDLDVDTGRVSRVRVTDFGLARASGATEPETSAEELAIVRAPAHAGDLTRTGAVVGTPAYMAPEQHLGGVANARSDQFSFCVALYEGLYGERPFGGMSYPEIVASTTGGAIRRAAGGTAVPGWLRAVVTRGLAVDPELRWPSMAELLDALDRDPTGPRRRRVAAAVVIGIALGTWGVVHLRERARVAACGDASHAVTAVWNDDVQARISAALLAAGPSYGAQTWARVHDHLDGHVAAWQQARHDSCVARAGFDPGLAAIQDECFASRLTGLGDRIEVLTAANAAVLNGAITMASDVEDEADCLDPARLELIRRAGANATARAQVAELRRQLGHASILQLAGAYEAAITETEAVRLAAESIGAVAVEASAEVLHGRVLHAMGRFVDAEGVLEDGFFAAVAARDAEAAWSAAAVLTSVCGSGLARRVDGLRWARQAEALRALFPDGSFATSGLLERNLGQVALTAGEYDTAIEHLERALALEIASHGEHSHGTVVVLRSLGTAFDALGEAPRANEHLERALALSEDTFGLEHPMVADANNDLGAALIKRDDHRAIAHFSRALTIYEAAGLEHKTAGAYDNLALVRSTTGEAEVALALNDRALEIRQRLLPPGHPSIADTLTNRGHLLADLGRSREAVSIYTRAIEMYAGSLGPTHERVGDATYNLANALVHLHDYTDALAAARRAVEIRRGALPQGHPKIEHARIMAAQAAIRAGDHAAALEDLRQLRTEVPEPPRRPVDQVIIEVLLGEALLDAGQTEAALAQLAAADVDLLDPISREEVEFVRVRALLAAGGDPTAAKVQAREIAARLRAAGHADAVDSLGIDAWLVAHDGKRDGPARATEK